PLDLARERAELALELVELLDDLRLLLDELAQLALLRGQRRLALAVQRQLLARGGGEELAEAAPRGLELPGELAVVDELLQLLPGHVRAEVGQLDVELRDLLAAGGDQRVVAAQPGQLLDLAEAGDGAHALLEADALGL